MSDETTLLPCPFCGGEAEFNIFDTICNVECPECFNGTRYYALDDYEQAVAAWNARAERTCKPEWTRLGKTQTQEFWLCECGNCGHEFGEEDRRSHPFKVTVDEVYIPNYCPNCGAKVVQQ